MKRSCVRCPSRFRVLLPLISPWFWPVSRFVFRVAIFLFLVYSLHHHIVLLLVPPSGFLSPCFIRVAGVISRLFSFFPFYVCSRVRDKAWIICWKQLYLCFQFFPFQTISCSGSLYAFRVRIRTSRDYGWLSIVNQLMHNNQSINRKIN